MIGDCLNCDLQQLSSHDKLTWMPAHKPVSSIGHVKKSNGKVITAVEWRANRLVDGLAKLAAKSGEAPSSTVELPKSAESLAKFAAAQLGVATHAANNHICKGWLDSGKWVNKTTRDAQQQPCKGGTKFAKPAPAKAPAAEPSSETNQVSERSSGRHGVSPTTTRRRTTRQRNKEHASAKLRLLATLNSGKLLVAQPPCLTKVEALAEAASASRDPLPLPPPSAQSRLALAANLKPAASALTEVTKLPAAARARPVRGSTRHSEKDTKLAISLLIAPTGTSAARASGLRSPGVGSQLTEC